MQARITAVLLFFMYLIFAAGAATGAVAQEPPSAKKQYQIVFATFDKSSAGRFAYLRDSVQAMLAGRLAAKDRIQVLDKTLSEEQLRTLEKKGSSQGLTIDGTAADYLVTGAIFSLTSGLEVQVELYPLVPNEEVLHFSAHSATPDTLIADVDHLSQEIARTAFGYPTAPAGGAGDAASGEEGNKAFVTAHPEAAYKRNQFSGSMIGVAGSGVMTRGRGPKMTATVPVDMRAMAVGDVNGDGQDDILLLAGTKLLLFGISDNKIIQLADTSLPSKLVVNAINLADLNGDGREEIYVSATDGLYVSSTIMRYDSTAGFTTLAANIPWYLRPVQLPGKGWRLAGQQRGLAKIDLIRPGVYLLDVDKKYELTKGERIALPESVNLFDFVYADLDGDNLYELVAVDQNEKLRVYNATNELMWVSQKNYAGSKVYLGPSQGEATSKNNPRNFTPNEDFERELIFVPARLIVTDINHDGRQEIIVSEGIKNVLSFFRRLRIYDSGVVVSLAWNDSALVESWRTSNFRGYVAGYGFTMLAGSPAAPKEGTKNDTSVTDNVSLGRLFIGNLPKSGSLSDLIPGGAETDLTIYDLEFTSKKQEEK